ncbi:MAG: 4Fe-4S binding protein [Acidobacteriota bacterium]
MVLGLRLLRGKLKEAALCLGAGRVTLPYPFEPPTPTAEGYRGLPRVDASRCIGCGGCVSVCTPNLISVIDEGPVARFTWELARCTYCGRCGEVCPEDAVTLSRDFETATNDAHDLVMTVEVFMASCNRCGRCYRTQTPLEPPHPRAFHERRVEALCDRWKDGGDRTAGCEGVPP